MAALCFLADESCDFAVVHALRGAGCDVVAVAEFTNQSLDPAVIAQAHREGLILLTEDKDLGGHAFVSHAASAGVMLIRFPSQARSPLGNAVLHLVREQADKLPGSFVVIQWSGPHLPKAMTSSVVISLNLFGKLQSHGVHTHPLGVSP